MFSCATERRLTEFNHISYPWAQPSGSGCPSNSSLKTSAPLASFLNNKSSSSLNSPAILASLQSFGFSSAFLSFFFPFLCSPFLSSPSLFFHLIPLPFSAVLYFPVISHSLRLLSFHFFPSLSFSLIYLSFLYFHFPFPHFLPNTFFSLLPLPFPALCSLYLFISFP